MALADLLTGGAGGALPQQARGCPAIDPSEFSGPSCGLEEGHAGAHRRAFADGSGFYEWNDARTLPTPREMARAQVAEWTRDTVAEPTPATLAAVADALMKLGGFEVTVEYPGHLRIEAHAWQDDGSAWHVGTANATWGGDVQTDDGTPGATFSTDVPSTSTDAAAIARAVLAALREYCPICGAPLDAGAVDEESALCFECDRREHAALASRGEA
jgi:hypothetical protein